MNNFNDIINNRRSIRSYTKDEVEDEKIDKILRSGMQAPGSRKGSEPHEFIVVKDPETLEKLGQIKPRVRDCNVAIVLLANIDRSFYKAVWQQDMSAVAQNMLLEACNLGLGGLWNGVAPREEVMNPISKIFNLPDNVKPFCIITLGYPTEDSTNIFIDKYDPERIHYEKY